MRSLSRGIAAGAKRAPKIDAGFARFPIRVARSPIQGWGVFAVERIPARRRVIEYTGERIPAKEARRRLRKVWRGGGSRRILIFRLNPRWCVDAGVGGSGAELINHSCAPNLITRKIGGHIYYYSRRAIRRGEELTVDYRFDPEASQVRCRCGTARCRGTINLKARREGRDGKAGGRGAAPGEGEF